MKIKSIFETIYWLFLDLIALAGLFIISSLSYYITHPAEAGEWVKQFINSTK
jgi:hypothetical protein